jgi:hypothetical protein
MSNIPYLSQLDENSSVTARDLAAMAAAIANTPIYTPAYKVYTALLSSTPSGEPPIVTVLENTLGYTPDWAAGFNGSSYQILGNNSELTFPLNKTAVFIGNRFSYMIGGMFVVGYQNTEYSITFYGQQISAVSPDGDAFFNTTIEIRVYN